MHFCADSWPVRIARALCCRFQNSGKGGVVLPATVWAQRAAHANFVILEKSHENGVSSSATRCFYDA
jgi:hypothetical protein